MYHVIEKNERRNRQNALVLAVALHLALGFFVYWQASATKPGPIKETPQTVAKTTPVKSRPAIRP